MSSRRAAVSSLTPRELEVAELLERGFTPKEIAHRLELSLATVRGHIESGRTRIGARTTHELVALLARGRATRAREARRTS